MSALGLGWFMTPNQEHMSLMLLGIEEFLMTSRYFLLGCTLSEVI